MSHRVFLACFGQMEKWRLFTVSGTRMETSSLAKYCMWIQAMWLVHQNPSIGVESVPPRASYDFLSKGGMNSIHSLRIAWKPPPLLCFSWGFKKCGGFIEIHPLASKRGHRVFLACFCKREEWRLFTVSEMHGNILPSEVLREDSRNVVSSSKFIHLHQKGATVCFWPVCVKGRNEESSRPKNCMETSSLAKFCLRIQEMRLVRQNSSICVENEPPCVSSLFYQMKEWRLFTISEKAWKPPPSLCSSRGFKKCC